MATIGLSGSNLGNGLQSLLMCEQIEPGDEPSYQTCKAILAYHPLGNKMAEGPVKIAQSQPRDLEIPGAPDRVKKAFQREWIAISANKNIRNFVKTSRAYGIASIALLQQGVAPNKPMDFAKLYKSNIAFNVFDPLNTAGSLVMNQDPNAMDFMKHGDIRVSSVVYHRSRTIVMQNGDPIYILYTSSSFGFTGRSVYQTALFPLKTFVQSMLTDDFVVVKVGVLVAKLKQVTSAVTQAVMGLFRTKLQVAKQAITGNVISVGHEEDIQSLNLQNLEGPYKLARDNVLKNIATAADMPARFLNQETMAEGFGEGSEDAANEARYINELRENMQPVYDWFDRIVMYRAWNEDFYTALQSEFPEQYGKVPYDVAFKEWENAFKAEWPSLLIEPESKQAEMAKVQLDALVEAFAALSPMLDPENKATLAAWVQDNFNNLVKLFPFPLELDFDALRSYVPPQPMAQDEGGEESIREPRPSGMKDSAGGSALASLYERRTSRRLDAIEGGIAALVTERKDAAAARK